MKDVLELVQKYFLDCFFAFTGFFSRSGGPLAHAEITDTNGWLVTLSLLCLAMGTVLKAMAVHGMAVSLPSYAFTLAQWAVFWICLSVLVWIVLRVLGCTTDFGKAFSAILRVDPISFLAASFIAWLTFSALRIFLMRPSDAHNWAAIVLSATHVVILSVFLPRSLTVAAGRRSWRIAVATVIAVLAVAFTELLYLSEPPPPKSTAEAIASSSAPIASGKPARIRSALEARSGVHGNA